ncbi:SprT-like domain-containing protein [Rhodopseudomonas sp. B29]|uniref:SprT-like domain-containing protein n=1 Tax=Rhodopseudomonas sp. B29 TaxID=95607 RepID=UPI0003B70709|nr:SprT-like domain-containing protein [Rhodopseudomonas sp. B29]
MQAALPLPLADNPTAHTYGGLDRAYAFFNKRLFGDTLPPCLITMQRHKGAYGYFAPQRFGSRDGGTITDEIALNPSHFSERDIRATLSTLAHEMAHLWQQHFGKPSRSGYHNKEWAAKMREIGLHPSSTGEPGGKETGQRVSHYIVDGGGYDLAYAAFEAEGGAVDLLGDRWSEDEKAAKTRAKKAASKTAFECPDCGLKAWAKPDAKLMCGECEIHMECEAVEA